MAGPDVDAPTLYLFLIKTLLHHMIRATDRERFRNLHVPKIIELAGTVQPIESGYTHPTRARMLLKVQGYQGGGKGYNKLSRI